MNLLPVRRAHQLELAPQGENWLIETLWSNQAVGWRAEYMPPDRSDDPNIQDGHRMAQCAAEPDKMWVQHHNGIFRTSDGGTSWHEVLQAGPSTFGFTVVVHPTHGDTAWFVPGVKDESA